MKHIKYELEIGKKFADLIIYIFNCLGLCKECNCDDEKACDNDFTIGEPNLRLDDVYPIVKGLPVIGNKATINGSLIFEVDLAQVHSSSRMLSVVSHLGKFAVRFEKSNGEMLQSYQRLSMPNLANAKDANGLPLAELATNNTYLPSGIYDIDYIMDESENTFLMIISPESDNIVINEGEFQIYQEIDGIQYIWALNCINYDNLQATRNFYGAMTNGNGNVPTIDMELHLHSIAFIRMRLIVESCPDVFHSFDAKNYEFL